MATVLAIETSCDETAAAVVSETGDGERPWRVRSNTVASQAEIHREWGGVVPELASRQHIRDICGVVERALDDGRASWSDLDAIAVTQGPGLVGSLLVGVAFAKGVAASLDVPLVPVHHLAGHIESLVIDNGRLPLPGVVLVVSGGHTNLYEVTGEEHPRRDCRLIGRTRDDAAGEAFDKVAALLGLTYPGGPAIDRVARSGNDAAVDFPVARMTHANRAANPAAPAVGIARRAAGAADGVQLQRAENGGEAARGGAARRAGGLRSAGRRGRGHLRQLPAGGGARPARPGLRGGPRLRRPLDRNRGRGVGELAPPSRSGGSGQGGGTAAGAADPGPGDRQRGDDRRRRPAAAAGRRHRAARPERPRLAGALTGVSR